MGKQFIITISREYGSGGHEIGRRLADALNVNAYDRSLLDEFAAMQGIDPEELFKYDEAPKKPFFSRTVRGFTNSPEVNVAELQFDMLRQKAASGESFVVIGRCADSIFRGFDGLLTVFVRGEYEAKLSRVMEKRNLSAKDAALTIERHDKNRRAYHNHFSTGKWGDSREYDLCINSSKLGIDGTIEVLKDYSNRFIAGLE